ncbi:MAG: glycosyltransferase [Lachnospiraceae bacterium]|jgi:lipopolysaccharide/colanic/teichoic acid biosynthesis glycosyltransferase/glycosyltransferase involved in cell wall biosynthesis|nr:glycosyltransferase [Lachnospiraceae bacterium]
MRKSKKAKILTGCIAFFGGVFALLYYVAKRDPENFDNNKKKVSQEPSKTERSYKYDFQPTIYEGTVKPFIDKTLSFMGLILLAPLYLIIAAAVYADDPGPVFFRQKRVGKDKTFFFLHKFRTMKLSTPHDVPTHQLSDPDQYITKVGRILRKYSLDELPQIWDIFRGRMSIIGPRPALWNQNDLIKEREKYGANSVMPGLTGWAQINGRDELEIPVKAGLDGEYVKHLKQGGWSALFFDVKCFLGTITSALKGEGVVEGGTGELHKNAEENDRRIVNENTDGVLGSEAVKDAKNNILVICQYYYPENFQITPICEHLARDGYRVTVLTGLPNYPDGVIPKEYRKGHRDEYINGVHVIRTYEIPRGKGAVKLGFNYLSYSLTSYKKVLELNDKFDLVFVYQLSPVLMGLPGLRYARKYKKPLFLYCCDLWPESMKMYIKNENNPVFKIVKTISRKIYTSADLLAVQSRSFSSYLRDTHGIPDERFVYMPAFADETYLEMDFSTEDEVTDFVFLGNLGIAQNLLAVLDAVNKIKNVPGFRVHFVGEGTCLNEMKEYAAKNDLKDIVKFYGRRPIEEMPGYYKLADVCLVSLKADNATGLTLPSKVQGYMAAGKPIIGMIDGSARKVIHDSNCGICVSADDIDGFAEVMKQFIENKEKYTEYGENGRNYFKENFCEDVFMNRLEQSFKILLGEN